MNLYKNLKEKYQQEIHKIPFIFAFTNEDLEREIKERNIDSNKHKLYDLGDGIFLFDIDFKKYNEIINRRKKEIETEIKNDITGEKFIKDMFLSEMKAQEYGYTKEIEDTLEELGFTYEDINNNKNLLNGLELAKKQILKEDELEETEEMGD